MASFIWFHHLSWESRAGNKDGSVPGLTWNVWSRTPSSCCPSSHGSFLARTGLSSTSLVPSVYWVGQKVCWGFSVRCSSLPSLQPSLEPLWFSRNTHKGNTGARKDKNAETTTVLGEGWWAVQREACYLGPCNEQGICFFAQKPRLGFAKVCRCLGARVWIYKVTFMFATYVF